MVFGSGVSRHGKGWLGGSAAILAFPWSNEARCLHPVHLGYLNIH